MKPIPYDTKSIADALTGSAVGHTIRYFGSIPSTMPIARDLAQDASTASGAVVVAEEQTAGRGRYNRRWETPYGTALLMSVILKPPHLLEPVSRHSLLAGVAVAEGIIEAVPELQDRIRLKWPNDVLVMSAGGDAAPVEVPGKVAGILLESAFTGQTAEHAVLGIGVNVGQKQEDLTVVRLDAPGVPLQPASLTTAAGRPVDREAVLIAICRRLAEWLTLPTTADDALYLRWRGLLETLGTEITVYEHGGSERESDDGARKQWHGRAVDVDPAGDLRIELADGTQRTLRAGDVSLRAATG